MKFLALIGLFSFSLFAADLEKRPLPFVYNGSLAVFADFKRAHYDITYDYNLKSAHARAHIILETAEAGHIIFDSHADPTSIRLNGRNTTATLTKTPNNETTVRTVDMAVAPGRHVLTIKLPILQLVEFKEDGVRSAFWMSDLTERGYLERYLPTNFMFDRIPTTFHVKFNGFPSKQKIYANGIVRKISDSEFRIRFRDGLNANCLYFHTVPDGSMIERSFTYTSIDGRKIPTIIYVRPSADQEAILERTSTRTIEIMDELENDYGAFPHPELTIYVAGQGGMEYSGATMTSESALGHELFHSYFARGVLHADGNSGWIDEALAKWRDNGYQTITNLTGTSQLAAQPYYTRFTDRAAYSFGERFMALLDGKLKSKGGLKPFLRETVANHSFAPVTTPEFINMMNDFYGTSFDHDFKTYVFGEGSNLKLRRTAPVDEGVHRQLTLSELQNLL